MTGERWPDKRARAVLFAGAKKQAESCGLDPDQVAELGLQVRVQVFICLATLLLTRVLEREAQARGWHVTGDSLLRELANVRLAMVLRAPGPKGGRPKADWMLEEGAPATMEAFRAWVPEGAV